MNDDPIDDEQLDQEEAGHGPDCPCSECALAEQLQANWTYWKHVRDDID